jgi:hypothetical protein
MKNVVGPKGPLFVLGSARSGTTAFSGALAHATSYRLGGEGHVWPLLLHLERTTSRYRDGVIAAAGGSQDLDLVGFADGLLGRNLLRLFLDNYAEDGVAWIDKTPGPEMIRVAPRLHDAFPDARFFLLKRHPIDAITSKLRRFPDTSFNAHCVEWAETYAEWLNVRAELGSAAMEIDQTELHLRPDGIALSVAEHVGESPAFSLAFAEHLDANRGVEQTDLKSRSRVVSLPETDWSDIEKIDFVDLCRPVADALGYDLDLPLVIDLDRQAVSLFFPRLDGETAFVTNRNDFCYPIRGGFQLHPNGSDALPLQLSYRGVSVSGQNRLQFSYRREFQYGAEVLLAIEVRRSADGVPILSQTMPVHLDRMVSTTFELEHLGSAIDIDIRVTAPHDKVARHAAILIYRPVIT